MLQHTLNAKRFLVSVLTKDQYNNDSNEVEASKKSLREAPDGSIVCKIMGSVRIKTYALKDK